MAGVGYATVADRVAGRRGTGRHESRRVRDTAQREAELRYVTGGRTPPARRAYALGTSHPRVHESFRLGQVHWSRPATKASVSVAVSLCYLVCVSVSPHDAIETKKFSNADIGIARERVT